MSIKYLENKEINYFRWDRCINTSLNSLIFANSWYLNTVAITWNALIEEDYSTVMPLPVVKRFGIRGIKTPQFVGQLGVFSIKAVNSEKINEFIDAIPSNFKFINLNFNKFNILNNNDFKIKEESVFEIDLVKDYQKIQSNYTVELRNKVINKNKNFSIIKGIQPLDYIEFYNESTLYSKKENLKLLRMLIGVSMRYRFGELYGAYDAYNNLCAAAFFIRSQSKIYLLHAFVSKEGIKNDSFYFLIDKFIDSNSHKYMTLTFQFNENKFHQSVYSQFGAIESKFQKVINCRMFSF